MRLIAIIVAGLVLAGCGDSSLSGAFADRYKQRGGLGNLLLGLPAMESREAAEQEQMELIVAYAASECARRGYVQGTQVYAGCVQVIALDAYNKVHPQDRTVVTEGGSQPRKSLSFLCKDAIARGDQTGVQVHC